MNCLSAKVIAYRYLFNPLDQNSLDIVQADGIVGAVLQLGRARRFMIRFLLRVLVPPHLQNSSPKSARASCKSGVSHPSVNPP